ncbi:type II toxin-antitoxin system RelE/ParE family toxin [Oceanicaulis sp. MMSF_3324]|uniref:type II toxin-antitoxin system RelE/ParE family toxin n=1 Tax=Oceanicaulis sp. MMSF_3324 TaxID=3046702 RepID=UPI003531F64D
MGYRLSQAAENDLIDIYARGLSLFGDEQAERYFQTLTGALEFLADHPFSARERLEISPPVRCHPHGRHIIIYLVEEDEQVFILRVRHVREDWKGPAP